MAADPALLQRTPAPRQTRAAADAPRGLLHPRAWERIVKRVIDVLVSAAILVVLSPLMAVVAVAVWVTSAGPVFFVQQRVGEFGCQFPMLKFRSMYVGSDECLDLVRDLNEVDGPVFKVRQDPRITPLGRGLRKFSLDELPQLVNVLRGQMSLVGPRPPLAEEVAEYRREHLERLLVRPGLTCTWQVSGRSNIDFDTWMEMDRDYIRHWTLMLDIRLLVRTIPALVRGDGAY